MTKSVKEKTRIQKIRDYKNGHSNIFDPSMIKLKIKIDSCFYDDKDEEFFTVSKNIYKTTILKYKEAIKLKLIPLVQKTHIFDYTLSLEVMTHFQEGFENHNELTAVLYVNGSVFSGNPFYININTVEKQKPSLNELVDIFNQLLINFINIENEKNFKISKNGAYIPSVKGLKLLNLQFKDTYFYNDIYRLYNFFYKYRKQLNIEFLEYDYNYLTESIDLTIYDGDKDYMCVIKPISYDDHELLINIYESGFIQSARENIDGLTLDEILDEHCMLTY